ncbi:TPA: inositol 2-dehydrogenase [Staphylococcus delphini]|uniref:inositol 2-dehydrogenase n=1 Tax=Staphylococcus delphini TaxID=53344 RepID=UPI000BBC1414|nr:inositol 2-dehydrogenase [Staphylococcus delphini]PCF46252.1 inositol 2-dehydrogenase [Staphylococcus delphini]PCF74417.1 inositol 2-dehydrogenase [Staphylococcus delphini]HEC2155844.1 inositol 2-dehydrogenase [Staphylococcus delphini]HEC2175453.1 inositol 2-dehydrogenase [Staphylococcus delphini]
MTLTIGVIGAGRIGQLHIDYLRKHPKIRIKWLSDINCDKLADWIEENGIEKRTKNHKDILNDPEVDAVVICSPTDTHVDIIKAACEKGKHIFCEKPISLTLSESVEAVKAVEKAGVKLQMGFNRRFDRNFSTLQKALKERALGEIQSLRITSRDPAPPPIEYVKHSGGLFMDMSIHDFDMARYLMQSEVVEVYAKGGALVNPELEEIGDIDTAIVTLTFENGALCVIENCRRSVYGYDQRVEVLGDKGSISVGNENTNTLTFAYADGIKQENPPFFFLERYKQAYEIEMNAFIDSILNNKEVLCSIIDGLKAQEIAEKCKESLIKGMPVKINS